MHAYPFALSAVEGVSDGVPAPLDYAQDERDCVQVSQFKTLDDLPEDLTGKKVLVRVDLNVPMQDGRGDRRHPAARRCADDRRA